MYVTSPAHPGESGHMKGNYLFAYVLTVGTKLVVHMTLRSTLASYSVHRL